MIVDVHAHIIERGFARRLAGTGSAILKIETDGDGFRIAGYGPADPLLFDLDGRLASLAARGVSLQLVAPPPPLWSKPGWAPTAEDARLMNDATARVVADAGGPLAGLAVLPLAEPAAAPDEMRRCFAGGRFAGVALPTTAAGRPLDEAGLDAVFAFLARTRRLVFMHSVTSEPRAILSRYTLNTVLGWPSETAIAVARLVFAGVFERHPLNLVLSHGGGVLPFLAGRIDLAHRAPRYERNDDCRRAIARLPSDYLRGLYFDTVVAGALALNLVVEFAGAERVMFGSDFPYEIGDADGTLAAPGLSAMPAEMRARILGANARRVLAEALDG